MLVEQFYAKIFRVTQILSIFITKNCSNQLHSLINDRNPRVRWYLVPKNDSFIIFFDFQLWLANISMKQGEDTYITYIHTHTQMLRHHESHKFSLEISLERYFHESLCDVCMFFHLQFMSFGVIWCHTKISSLLRFKYL